MPSLEVANEIARQLGGVRLLKLMTGAFHFVGDDTSLMFSFKGSRKASKCRINLDASDTYTVQFFKTGRRGLVTVYDRSGFYNDQLVSLFEEVTGLYLSF